MILWFLIAAVQQLVTKSMCIQHVNKSFMFEEKRAGDVLILVSDEAFYHMGGLFNVPFRNIQIDLSNGLYKNLLLCDQTNMLNESMCASQEKGQHRVFAFRLEKNIALNGVKTILDKVNLYYATKPHLNLYSLILISNSKVIKMFNFIFKFSNYLVFYLDVNRSFNFVQTSYENEIKQDKLSVSHFK